MFSWFWTELDFFKPEFCCWYMTIGDIWFHSFTPELNQNSPPLTAIDRPRDLFCPNHNNFLKRLWTLSILSFVEITQDRILNYTNIGLSIFLQSTLAIYWYYDADDVGYCYNSSFHIQSSKNAWTFIEMLNFGWYEREIGSFKILLFCYCWTYTQQARTLHSNNSTKVKVWYEFANIGWVLIGRRKTFQFPWDGCKVCPFPPHSTEYPFSSSLVFRK